MPDNLSLDFFKTPAQCYYHVYKISDSAVAEVWHSHSFYQICYVAQGEIYHSQEGEQVHLTYGDAFIVPPGFIHSIAFPNPETEIYSLSFQEELFHPGFSRSNVYRFMAALNLDSTNDKRVNIKLKLQLDESQRMITKSLFECLIRESQSASPRELSACGSLIAAILCVMSQAYFSQPQRMEKLQSIEESTKAIEQCIRYIDQNFMHHISISCLTRRFAVSRTTFSLLFPRIAGSTLKRYIAQKRVEQATALVQLDGSLTFGEISKMVGYEDFSTFYRNFTRVTGLSPTQYRTQSTESRKPREPRSGDTTRAGAG